MSVFRLSTLFYNIIIIMTIMLTNFMLYQLFYTYMQKGTYVVENCIKFNITGSHSHYINTQIGQVSILIVKKKKNPVQMCRNS